MPPKLDNNSSMGEPVLFCCQFGCGLDSVVAASIDADRRPGLNISGPRPSSVYRKQNGGPPICSLDLFLNTARARETICSFYAGAPILNTPRFREETIPLTEFCHAPTAVLEKLDAPQLPRSI